jgi:multidrug resistance efflux pump
VKKAFTEKHQEMEELLEKAEKAMNDAEEEYKKAQQFTETEAQQQHLERAKEAYDEAEAAYKAAKEDKEEVSDLCD